MFTTDCFIRKNSASLRRKLEKIGYVPANGNSSENDGIRTDKHGFYYVCDFAPCLGFEENEELFLAIAALRNDSDYMQYFVTEVEQHWVNQQIYIPKGSFELCLINKRIEGGVPAHKASVEELIEHFKK